MAGMKRCSNLALSFGGGAIGSTVCVKWWRRTCVRVTAETPYSFFFISRRARGGREGRMEWLCRRKE